MVSLFLSYIYLCLPIGRLQIKGVSKMELSLNEKLERIVSKMEEMTGQMLEELAKAEDKLKEIKKELGVR